MVDCSGIGVVVDDVDAIIFSSSSSSSSLLLLLCCYWEVRRVVCVLSVLRSVDRNRSKIAKIGTKIPKRIVCMYVCMYI